MARFDPTPQQARAINSRARLVVVSAGAGSGKTAVLSQRIVSRLCNDRADIDRFLVVTYTNAAAFEMRERIAENLTEKITENLDNPALCEHLRRQVGKLSSAKVQTVHSFCLELVRRNASTLGLSSRFGIGDEDTLAQLWQAAIDKTLNDAYAERPEGFEQLRRCLCEERGDKKLAAAVQSVFERLQSLPYPENWLREQMAAPASDEHSRNMAMQECVYMISAAVGGVLNVQNILTESAPDIAAAAEPCLSGLCAFGEQLQTLLESGDTAEALKCIDGYRTVNIRAPKGAPEHIMSFAKSARDNFKETLADIKKLLSLPDGGEETNAAERCLCALVLRYSDNLRQEKNRAEVVDFSDLEHFAVKLLSDDDGGGTPLSEELRSYLCELMVDEYQDSNRVQDTIFNLLSPYDGSAFFVGDIKQSIYRFRKADPRIFAEKCRMAQHNPDSEYIAMNTNFRSRREVLELCNYFFERSMSEGFGDVDYAEPGQGLDAGREVEGNLPSELCLLDTPSLKQGSDGDEGISTAEAEAEFVASRIRDMLASHACLIPEKDGARRARASDFAILLSSYKGKAPIFQKALARLGLDSDAEREQDDPFGSVEASIIISLLRIVSNRRQDIPLLSVMRSPLFAFDAEEIAALRAKNPGGDLWDSVFLAARSGDTKAKNFVSELDHLTEVAKDLSCAGFLQYVYARFGAYGLFSALGDAQRRAATLDLLYETALNCEKGSFAHVSRLVEHIDHRTVKKSASAPAGDGVRIMSIHKSKGLEFPFVFVCDLCKDFNTDDVDTDVLLHTEKGLAIRRADNRLRTRTATKKRFIISRHILSELRAEELRKLYVAMTRAREKLFLVVSSGRSTVEKTVTKTYEKAGDTPGERFFRSQSSASRWLIAALFGHPGAALLRSCLPGEHPADEETVRSLICSQVVSIKEQNGAPVTVNRQTEDGEQDFDPMEYLPLSKCGYRFDHISRLPSKVTPSGASMLREDVQRRVYFAPEEDAGAQGLTAAEKGTRVHELLSRITPTADLTADQVMEAFSDCEREDAEMASGFYRSALGRQAADAAECLREYQFSVLLTPRELELGEEDDEFILLNGSIDMLLLTPEGMVIIDFKTDSVKAGEEAVAAEKHRKQLEIYALAAEKIFEKPVIKKSVFFLKTAAEAVL